MSPHRRWWTRSAAGAGELLEDVQLFDVYTGPQIGEGRKSLTLALRFRAPDRTLTEDEASAARDAAVPAAEDWRRPARLAARDGPRSFSRESDARFPLRRTPESHRISLQLVA